MKKTKKKKLAGRPAIYPYVDMTKGEVKLLEFNTQAGLAKARCAAHTLAFSHGWRFKTTRRISDDGRFELLIEREY